MTYGRARIMIALGHDEESESRRYVAHGACWMMDGL